jgi:hypothetical protein
VSWWILVRTWMRCYVMRCDVMGWTSEATV